MVNIICLLPKDWKKYREIKLRSLSEEPDVFGASFTKESKFPRNLWIQDLRPLGKQKSEQKVKLWFAEDHDRIVGIIALKFSRLSKMSHVGRVGGFYVSSESRKKGVGTKLLKILLLYAERSRKISKLKLMVNTRQLGAISLYKKFGFTQVGILHREFKVGKQYFDMLLMEKLL